MTVLRMGPELLDELSASALFRLGRGDDRVPVATSSRCCATGKDAGVFGIEDPDLVANTIYALGLGGLQLARLGVVVRESARASRSSCPSTRATRRRAAGRGRPWRVAAQALASDSESDRPEPLRSGRAPGSR